MSINKVILVGNVGKDPEVRYLDKGVAIARFPLATSETYKGKDGERVTSTEWHNIVLWRGLAETAEKYVKKGSQLYIEGKIRTRNYDDKDGNKKYFTEIVADQMQMLGRRQDSAGEEQTEGRQEAGDRQYADQQSSKKADFPSSYDSASSSGTDNASFDTDSTDEDSDLPF